MTDTRRKITDLERDSEFQKTKLRDLTKEIADALMGNSKFTPDMLSMAIEKCKQKIVDNNAEIQELHQRLENQEEELTRIDYYYSQFKSWADEFDKATLERKRMIADELLSEVYVGKGYEVSSIIITSIVAYPL